jgi:hypothetical protein
MVYLMTLSVTRAVLCMMIVDMNWKQCGSSYGLIPGIACPSIFLKGSEESNENITHDGWSLGQSELATS